MHSGVPVTAAPVTDRSAQASSFLATFDEFARQRGVQRAGWVAPLRAAASARFAALGFPTRRHEEWRFTDLAPLAKSTFMPAERPTQPVTLFDLAPYLLGAFTGHRLVFINGFYAPAWSRLGELPAGCAVRSLAEALDTDAASLEPVLARYADYQEHACTALNTAFLREGAYIHIPDRVAVSEPIHLLYVTVPGGPATVTHPRNLIVVGQRSQASIVESFVGLGAGRYFTNAVTELVADEDAVVDHYKVELESTDAYHVGTLQFHQSRGSALSSHCVSLGGGLVRHDINAVLAGEGCRGTLHGLFMLTGQQHVDNHLRVEHARPHGASRESFHGILDGHAHGVFTGRIVVHKGAQKTDAKQTNRNLLLSEHAQIDTKPQLEIFADDVKCTHGATIGQIDSDALFYLRARGIPQAAARSLLTYAFAQQSLAQIKVEPLRRQVHQAVVARLPQGELFRELS